MDKQETRVKCNSCGKAYKIKVPVTDKPVSFKCKNCGNVMKIKATGAATPADQPPPPPSFDGFESFPGFEETPQAGGPAHQGPPAVGRTQASGSGSSSPPIPDEFQFEDDGQLDFTTMATQPGLMDKAGPAPAVPEFKFETSQLPEDSSFHSGSAPLQPLQKTPSVVEALQTSTPTQAGPEQRRWLTLVNEEVRGPFTNEELRTMIENGSVTPETSLRMGERPWIKASQVPAFRRLFGARGIKIAGKLDGISLPDQIGEQEAESDAQFSFSIGSVLPFPLGGGTNWQPLAIFTGIAVVLCAVLSLEFMIGLPVSIVGWIVLYGYLGLLMQNSMKLPTGPPPPWDFKNIAGIAANGASLFLVLFVYSLGPVTICLLLMIAFFLNGMSLLGYVFIGVTVLVYAGSLFLVPAVLAVAGISGSLGTAINPSKPLGVIMKAGSTYMLPGGVSVAIGLVLMVTTILGIFLSDIPGVGFVVVGLLMGAVFSYGHFVWFHVLGLFWRGSERLVRQVVSGARAN